MIMWAMNRVTLGITDGNVTPRYFLYHHGNNVNDPPVITSTPGTEGRTGVAYLYQMEATDIDPGASLTYSAVEKPVWLQVNGITGLVYGVPSKDHLGTHSVTLKVSDGELEDTQSFFINVIDYNSPPEVVSEPADSALVGMTYTYGFQAVDLENDPLTYFEVQVPDWLTFYPASKVLIGMPGSENVGKHLVTLGVSDPSDTTYNSFYVEVYMIMSSGTAGTELHHRVYPNPVTSEVVIDLDLLPGGNGGFEFMLYDLNARCVYRERGSAHSNRFSLQGRGLTDGVYLYHIRGEEGGTYCSQGRWF